MKKGASLFFLIAPKLKYKNKQGFTLIEIIVVLVIMGILASIALPNIYSWIERSHAAEAALTLKTIADELDTCIAKGQSVGACMNQMDPCHGIVQYGTSAGCTQQWNTYQDYGFASAATSYFQYEIDVEDDGPPLGPSYVIHANRVGVDTSSCSDGSAVNLCNLTNFIGPDGNCPGGQVFLCRNPDGSRQIVGNGIYTSEF